jgi:BAH domain
MAASSSSVHEQFENLFETLLGPTSQPPPPVGGEDQSHQERRGGEDGIGVPGPVLPPPPPAASSAVSHGAPPGGENPLRQVQHQGTPPPPAAAVATNSAPPPALESSALYAPHAVAVNAQLLYTDEDVPPPPPPEIPQHPTQQQHPQPSASSRIEPTGRKLYIPGKNAWIEPPSDRDKKMVRAKRDIRVLFCAFVCFFFLCGLWELTSASFFQYERFQRGSTVFAVHDFALFHAGDAAAPFLGRIESLFETPSKEKRCMVNWYYRPADTEVQGWYFGLFVFLTHSHFIHAFIPRSCRRRRCGTTRFSERVLWTPIRSRVCSVPRSSPNSRLSRRRTRTSRSRATIRRCRSATGISSARASSTRRRRPSRAQNAVRKCFSTVFPRRS